jgi:hypothetical protein
MKETKMLDTVKRLFLDFVGNSEVLLRIESLTHDVGLVLDKINTLGDRFTTVRLERPLPAERSPVYVTLRGKYRVPGQEKEEFVLHGWTQKVEVSERNTCSIVFEPYADFVCERVDILGPAVILDARVGNMSSTLGNTYANPATLEFSKECPIGSRVIVVLEGTP